MRRVQKLCEQGRVKGAYRVGRTWLIPADAEKPGDPRFERKPPAKSTLQAALDRAIEVTFITYPRDDPYRVLDTISDARLRLIPEALFAYIRGDFEHAKPCFLKADGDDAVKLTISGATIAAAISTGDYPLFLEVEKWLKDIIKAELGAGVTAYAQYALAIGYMGALAPDMVAEWIKSGNFTDIHPQARYEALYSRILYLQHIKKYESSLDVAQTVMLLRGCTHQELSNTDIKLRIRCASACHCLGRESEAKHWLMGAMDIALPHGFITYFTETITLLGGLTERCLKQSYPCLYDAVIEQSAHTLANWLAFHNRFTKDNIPWILTIQEREIATLAARKVPRAKIARQLQYSEQWVDKQIGVVYEKLQISNRGELAQYVIE